MYIYICIHINAMLKTPYIKPSSPLVEDPIRSHIIHCYGLLTLAHDVLGSLLYPSKVRMRFAGPRPDLLPPTSSAPSSGRCRSSASNLRRTRYSHARWSSEVLLGSPPSPHTASQHPHYGLLAQALPASK